MSRKKVIFCDFDGTITVNDNIVSLMEHYKPKGWDNIVKEIGERTISIQEGVAQLFSLFPVTMKDEIQSFAIKHAELRSGFGELLEYCKQQDIEFLVTSGGMDFFIDPLLEPFNVEKSRIFCNSSDFSGETIRIIWPHPCDDVCSNGKCGMCKSKIIRSYPKEQYESILIGDSVTDFEGAKLVDHVFARSHLIDLCREHHISYIPFDDFHDVVKHLQLLMR